MGLHFVTAFVLALLLASCVAHRLPVAARELPGGTNIEARNEGPLHVVATALADQNPRVVATLGTNEGWPRNVRVGLDELQARASTFDWGISISDVGADLALVVAHELVHWHAAEHWDTLPYGLEEGMAWVLGAGIGGIEKLTLEAPSRSRLEALLNLPASRFMSETEREDALACAWLFAKLGMAKVEALARRAHSEDRSKIPASWAMPKSMDGSIEVLFTNSSVDSPTPCSFEVFALGLE